MHKSAENIWDINGADIFADFGMTEQGTGWDDVHRNTEGAITQTTIRRREG